MKLLDRFFGKKAPGAQPPAGTSLEVFNAYSPAFTSWNGGLYESALVREAIYAKGRHIMKLRFDMQGSAKRSLYNAVKTRPNPWSTHWFSIPSVSGSRHPSGRPRSCPTTPEWSVQ